MLMLCKSSYAKLTPEVLHFAPRKAIKSQALADFVAEWTDTQLPPAQIQAECWTMYFDGSLMKTGAGAGLLFISPLGVHMRYMIRLHFAASNNTAEYEALVNGCRSPSNLEYDVSTYGAIHSSSSIKS